MATPTVEGEQRIYTDVTDDNVLSGWAPGRARNIEDKADVCKEPNEHRGCVADPRLIVRANAARRRRADGDLPKISFYAFVQHEGDVVITKKRNPHLVVSIGQTFGVAKNFVEPQHVLDLWEKGEGWKKCRCPDGNLADSDSDEDMEGGAETRHLSLRALQSGQKRPLEQVK